MWRLEVRTYSATTAPESVPVGLTLAATSVTPVMMVSLVCQYHHVKVQLDDNDDVDHDHHHHCHDE